MPRRFAHQLVLMYRGSIRRANDSEQTFKLSPISRKRCVTPRLLRGVRVLRNGCATVQQVMLRVACARGRNAQQRF